MLPLVMCMLLMEAKSTAHFFKKLSLIFGVLETFFGVAEGHKKIQFSADLGLVKPRAIIDSSN